MGLISPKLGTSLRGVEFGGECAQQTVMDESNKAEVPG